ncbi:hypothetical protein [uncultured Helicobacter sp.]|uniref:hypothetical protein n=1 Tax=uncultured Helicobacter sp. TaxID=175537 RepID=UPI00263365D4|nr:hypothetical protein [uncultured Helicobacter sp.]
MRKILILPNLTGNPTLLGIYAKAEEQWNLIESRQIQNPLSDNLVPLFMELRQQGIIFDSLYFVRGPGSFMALKLIYLFAKTLEIAQNIKLYATHAFHFNGNSPIKAYGNCYFIKENMKREGATSKEQNSKVQTLEEEAKEIGITLQRFDTPPPIQPFVLPSVLEPMLFNTQLKPLYLLPPV